MFTRRETLRGGTAAVVGIAVTGTAAAAAPAIAKSATSRDLPASADERLLELQRQWKATHAEMAQQDEWYDEQRRKMPAWAQDGPLDMRDLPEFADAIGPDKLGKQPFFFEVEEYNRCCERAAKRNPKLLAKVKAQGRARMKAYEARYQKRKDLWRELGIDDRDEQMEPYVDRMDEIEEEIARTPAITVAGMAVKLWHWNHIEGPVSGGAVSIGEKMALSALEDAERLAGEVSS